jgi:hypothetical protein
VEDTLRESGSGKFGEIQLCEIVAMLVHFSSASKTQRNTVDTDGEKKDISELAHALLLFVEQLITFLMEAKARFEQSPGSSVFAYADEFAFPSCIESNTSSFVQAEVAQKASLLTGKGSTRPTTRNSK